ncbi:MAG: biotin/lipoyl-binding protein [Propioniciclava sp.]
MKRRSLVALTVIVVAAVVITLISWPREADAAYVVAPAARGTVTETATLVGPVTRETQAEVSFDTPGQVTSVRVALGDEVSAGDIIATIDPAPLRLTVLSARAGLAQAEAQLDADLTAQKNGDVSPDLSLPGAADAQPMVLPAQEASGGSITGMGGSGETPAYLADLESSLAAVQQAITRQQQVCTPVFSQIQELRDLGESVELPTAIPTNLATPTSPTPTTATSSTPAPSTPPATTDPGGSPTPTATASPTPSATPTPTPSPTAASTPTPPPTVPTELPSGLPTDPGELADFLEDFQGCSTAMGVTAQAEAGAGAALMAASQGMAEANQAAAEALVAAQQELAAATEQASQAAMVAAQSQVEEQLAALSGGMVTDATIARDRAALLEARQELASAESDLSGATLTAPISGTIGQLGFATGETSAGASATLVGAGAARISVEVPLSVRGLVAPGTTATVGQVSATPTLTGQVVTASVLPSQTTENPTYATEILSDDPDRTLNAGAYAEVTLDLRSATDVLTVPASALTMVTDTTGTVETVDGARATAAETVTVVVGSRGQGRVEIVSGLADGQLVVLADRRLPVPGGLEQYDGGPPSSSQTPD